MGVVGFFLWSERFVLNGRIRRQIVEAFANELVMVMMVVLCFRVYEEARSDVCSLTLCARICFLPDEHMTSRSKVKEGASVVQQKKKILGSRPPGCVNKCMSCSPCRATLVIPPHHKMIGYRDQSSHGEDDCYYLLSWKCKCGDKLFQP